MQIQNRLSVAVALLLVTSGCVGPLAPSKLISVRVVVVESDVVVAENFQPLPYQEVYTMVRTTSPTEMNGESLAIITWGGWGSKARALCDEKLWSLPVGATIEFKVREGDIVKHSLTSARAIRADKIEDMKAAEPGATDNPGDAQ